ncbi:MAG: hypothetical protein CMH62_00040 [Nanoarchaeota archaeon]|nr:hypothetical protein [Nanoarchaeota archaeon]|tara:strand:- start:58 stop:420 length:363 start_codon:yes stop_codon:yes gene_type:complete
MLEKFLYPDTTKDKVMEELDKIVDILQNPVNPEEKKNIRILRNFTKSLFIVSHKKLKKPQVQQSIQPKKPQPIIQPKIQPIPQIKKPVIQQKKPVKKSLPPPPPPPKAPTSKTPEPSKSV